MAMARALGGAVGAYYKPTLGKIVLRKPDANQTSEKLLAQQASFATKMTGNNIASACKGLKWDQFKACLRREGRKAY